MKDNLKEYIEENFDFDGLQQAGFWDKGTGRKDYEKQAARVCAFFGFKSVYEYDTVMVDNWKPVKAKTNYSKN